MSNVCNIWEPSTLPQPTKRPQRKFSYIPLYPVCFISLRKNVNRKSWLWLWECECCQREIVGTSFSIIRCSCSPITVDTTARKIFPKNVTTICQLCNNEFIFKQLHKHYIVKYCCIKCSAESQAAKNKERAAKRNKQTFYQVHGQSRQQSRKDILRITNFDRSMCVRGEYKILCDNYSVCQDHRVCLEYGPYYKSDKSCYVCNKLERMLY